MHVEVGIRGQSDSLEEDTGGKLVYVRFEISESHFHNSNLSQNHIEVHASHEFCVMAAPVDQYDTRKRWIVVISTGRIHNSHFS